jgi:DNA-binding LacI/PurR family transcriptional regulator
MAKNLDIIDVAREAGVSIATVSRVINNIPVVKEETRRKVLKVLEKTNYRVNAVAKNLRTRKTNNIGIIYTSVMMAFYNTISKGVEDRANKNNYSVFFCNSDDDPHQEQEYLSVLHEKRVDGIILSPTGKNVEQIQRIIAFGIPVCFIDRTVGGVTCDTVIVNNRQVSRRAVEFLIGRNYKNIGFVSGPTERSNAMLRHRGYLDALEQADRPADESLIRYGDYTFQSGYALTQEILDGRKIDALFVANERMGGGALRALDERGIKTGSDLGFVMWDDPFWTTLIKPNITAISQPVYTIGTTAADLLFKRIEGENEYDSEPVEVTLEADLIIRDSA